MESGELTVAQGKERPGQLEEVGVMEMDEGGGVREIGEVKTIGLGDLLYVSTIRFLQGISRPLVVGGPRTGWMASHPHRTSPLPQDGSLLSSC